MGEMPGEFCPVFAKRKGLYGAFNTYGGFTFGFGILFPLFQRRGGGKEKESVNCLE